MKLTLKILKRTLLIIIGVILVSIASVYFWISNRWSSFITENEMRELALIVDDSPELTNEYYQIYDKIYPNNRQRTMNGEIFQGILSLFFDKQTYKCPCRNLYHNLKEENNILNSKTEWND